MNKIILVFILLFSGTAFSLSAQSAQAEGELTQLLHDFMEGASQNDAAMHDRFWAEDLIYTSSSGERFGKAEIMSGFDQEENMDTEGPTVTYRAEDIHIQLYGDMAVVAFRLVGETETAEGVETDHYLNSGTFIKRDGEWKVVNWQATKVPG